jgi:hypothetical protein
MGRREEHARLTKPPWLPKDALLRARYGELLCDLEGSKSPFSACGATGNRPKARLLELLE